MRMMWRWCECRSLPSDYLELQGEALKSQMRARKEAQHRYPHGVQGRSVVETLSTPSDSW